MQFSSLSQESECMCFSGHSYQDGALYKSKKKNETRENATMQDSFGDDEAYRLLVRLM